MAEIHSAASKGDLQRVATLLKGNPRLVFSLDENGESPLHLAAWNGQTAVAKLLLSHRAPVDLKDRQGDTPLHGAAWNGHIDVTRLLLRNRASVNPKNELGDTPLHWTAQNGHTEVAKLLLANESGVHIKNNAGQAPPEVARAYGQHHMEHLPDWPRIGIFQDAVKAGVHSVEVLLADNPRIISETDIYDRTLLHWAADIGDKSIVDMLLRRDAPYNTTDHHGFTPLLIAVVRARREYRHAQKWWETAAILCKAYNVSTTIPASNDRPHFWQILSCALGFRQSTKPPDRELSSHAQTPVFSGTPNEACLAALSCEKWDELNYAKPSEIFAKWRDVDKHDHGIYEIGAARLFADHCTPAQVIIAVQNWKVFIHEREQLELRKRFGSPKLLPDLQVRDYELSSIYVVGDTGRLYSYSYGERDGLPILPSHHAPVFYVPRAQLARTVVQLFERITYHDTHFYDFHLCILRTSNALFKCVAWEHDIRLGRR